MYVPIPYDTTNPPRFSLAPSSARYPSPAAFLSSLPQPIPPPGRPPVASCHWSSRRRGRTRRHFTGGPIFCQASTSSSADNRNYISGNKAAARQTGPAITSSYCSGRRDQCPLSVAGRRQPSLSPPGHRGRQTPAQFVQAPFSATRRGAAAFQHSSIVAFIVTRAVMHFCAVLFNEAAPADFALRACRAAGRDAAITAARCAIVVARRLIAAFGSAAPQWKAISQAAPPSTMRRQRPDLLPNLLT